MPERTVETCEVKWINILDEKGNADESLMPPLPDSEIRRMYETLILARTFDKRALSLQREGRLGTYASILGQEASQVGSALALERSDWVFPSFRETGVCIALGYPMHMLFQYWLGDERGLRTPDDMNVFPISIPVGTHIPHAVGVAFAARYRGDRIAAVAYFGDGGTSKGDFHEGFNMAGVFKVPAIFICQNNQWAISVPRERQSASKTLAQKAFAYGFEGIQVDGNDILAVYKVTKYALEKAKQGKGPTFLECFTYRISHHTTADDATRYRQEEEVERWKLKDPVLRLQLFMRGKGLWDDRYRQEVEERAKAEVDSAVKTAESTEPPDPKDIIRYTYARTTPRQERDLKGF